MKKLKIVLVLLLSVVLFNVSCSSNDDDILDSSCKNYEANILAITAKYSEAYAANYQNSTKETCNALKTETQNLINFLEDSKDCIPDSEQENITEYINSLKEELTVTCN